MSITKDESVFCCFCCRKMGSFEGFWVMFPGWHRHAFTCGHETKYECPECAEKNKPQWTVCRVQPVWVR
jgi:hypothetical protein